MSSDELLIEVLDAVDALTRELDLTLVNRGKLERLLSRAYLEGRKSGLEAAQAVLAAP